MKFKSKPLVAAVRQAIEAGVFDAQPAAPSQPSRSEAVMAKAKRKTPVRWKKNEVIAVATDIYPQIVATQEFPISRNKKFMRLGLNPLVLASQEKVLPVDRHIMAVTNHIRNQIIGSLNYHHKKYLDAVKMVATAPTVAAPATVTGNDSTSFELGQKVGAHLKGDDESMKSFIAGIVQAITK